MDPPKFNLAQIRDVGLIFLGHKEEQNPVKKLNSVQGCHAHVQKDSVQHRHGDVFEEERQFDRGDN